MPPLVLRAASTTLILLAGCQGLAHRAAIRSLDLAPAAMDHGLDAQVLPSGLRLAVFQVPGQRDATLSLAMGAGQADEPDGKAGLAHVALRAALLAPRGRGGASILERLYAAGALVWVSDRLDETAIAIRYRMAFQDTVVASISELLDHPDEGVTEAAIRLAREEHAAALERQSDTADAATLEVQRLALAGTAFGRPAPTPAGVRALTVEDVRGFLRGSYAPRRTVLWASSGLETEAETRRLLESLRGLAAGDAAHPVAPEQGFTSHPPPERIGTREVRLTGGQVPRVVLAWRAPGARYGPSASMAGFQVRETMSRRAAWPELAGKVRSVDVKLQVLDRASVLLLEVELERLEDAAVVREAMLGASRSASGLWSMRRPATLAAWRRELRLERELELSEGWMGSVGRLVRAVGSADVPTWLDLNEQSQIGGSVSGWLDAWVDPGPTIVATISPTVDAGSTASARSAADDRTASQTSGPINWPTSKSLVAGAVPGVDQLDRLLEPAGLEQARRERLPNGIELLVLRRSGLPHVTLSLLLPGGAVRPSEGLAAQQALRRARSRLHDSGCELAPEARVYADGILVRVNGPVSWLPAVVEAGACWGRPLSAPDLKVPSPDDAMAWLAYDAALTGGPLPERSGGRAWTEAYLERVGKTDGAVVVLAGDVEPEAALRQLRESFGRARSSGAVIATPEPAWPRARRVILADVPGAKQASVTLFLRVPDQLSFTSASRVTLSSLFSERALETLGPSGLEVESQGAALGRARFETLTVSGPAALVPAAAGELLRELERLRDRGPTTIDAEAARWNAARRVAYRHDSMAGAAAGVLGLAADGLPLDTWNGFAAELRRVDASAIRDLVRASSVGSESLLLRGDAATLVPLLARLGLVPEVLAPPARKAK